LLLLLGELLLLLLAEQLVVGRHVVVEDAGGRGGRGGEGEGVIVDGGEGGGEGGGVGGLPAGVRRGAHGGGAAGAVVGRHLLWGADGRTGDLQGELLPLGEGGRLQVGGDARVEPVRGLVLVVDEVGVPGGGDCLLPAVGHGQFGGRGRGARGGRADCWRGGGRGGFGGGAAGRGLLPRVVPLGGLRVVV